MARRRRSRAQLDVRRLERAHEARGQRRDLVLREPKYNPTAAYCHFGREPYTEKKGGNTLKFFAWEDAKDLGKYAKMTSAAVEKELTSKKKDILAKWVD